MEFLGAQGAELWTTITTPQAVDLATRIKWLMILAIVSYWIGLLIGQTVLSRNAAYYPKDRFRVATAWILTGYAFCLTLFLGIGWWRHGQASWPSLGVHITMIVIAILLALIAVPPKPEHPVVG